MTEDHLPDFHADGWVHVARLALAASAALSVIMAAVLLTVAPPDQCPAWRLPGGTTLWDWLFVWTVPILAFNLFIAIRWNWVVRKGLETAKYPLDVPVTYVLVRMCLLGAWASQIPWLYLIVECTDWPERINRGISILISVS